jgi:hypothetical protein
MQMSYPLVPDAVLPAAQDSIRADSPLPDPMVPIVQFMFQQPEWVMVGGLILGAILALIVLFLLWRNHVALLTWLRTRNQGLKIAMATTVAAIVLAAAGTGVAAMNYMEHDNDFCLGCHIMVPAGEPFVHPDTGTYLLVNRMIKDSPHDSLECHDCHEPDMMAQAKELVLWMTERPEKVPPHGELTNRVCEKCHEQGEAKESWQAISQTAGHKVHFESDSSALEDLQCVTCHALEVHRFVPVDSTCYQKGCHLSDSVGIRIGAMRAQTDLHCVTCHEFTAEPVFQASRAGQTGGDLTPQQEQCFSCHEMRVVLEAFDPALDPHDATCGMCHNPHQQASAEEARKSCATAQCHADWRMVKFHVGAAHRKVAERCLTCHQPHAARVDASDCEGCHEAVRKRGGRNFTPPVPFDTTRALQQTHRDLPRESWELSTTSLGGTVQLHGAIDPPPTVGPPGGRSGPAALPTSPADTFSHRQHRDLTCLTCHTVQSGQGSLRFIPPRGCQICHHQAPARSRCAECHEEGELAEPHPSTVRVAVQDEPPRDREVPFAHETHREIACQECHTQPVSLEPATPVSTCTNCHEDHHTAERSCAACHRSADPAEAHGIDAGHEACAQCHDPATVARLTPVRTFCLTCHDPEADHYPRRQCTECHFQTSPEAYQSRLSASEVRR